jgi:hypothetical protein
MQITWTPTAQVTLEMIQCAACGMPYSFPARLLQELRSNGDTFYCPIGHQNVFRENTEKKLREEIKKREAAEKAAADAKRKAESATGRADWYERAHKEESLEHKNTRKALGNTLRALTNTKKKIAAGECPSCHQHFADLADHMGNDHPDYVISASPEEPDHG